MRQPKKRVIVSIIVVLCLAIALVFLLRATVFGHEHFSAAPADCTVDRYCDECGKLIWAAHPHTPGPAPTSCIEPQVCTECGQILSTLPHTPGPEATCTAPQVCTVCGVELAPVRDHEADSGQNCEMPQICKYCGKVLGDPIGHSYTTSADGRTKTCERCGQIVHLGKSGEADFIPETQADGHYHNDIDAFYAGSVLVCGDYGMEYFTLPAEGDSGYANLVNTFAAKYPEVHTSCLLIPKACAFLSPQGYGSVQENQADFIRATYEKMQNVTTADCMGEMKKHAGAYMFYRTDHHWTSLGAYYASVAYCEANGIDPRALQTYRTVVNTGYIGSLYAFAGEVPQLLQNPDYTVAHLPETAYTMTCTTGGTTFDTVALNTDTNAYATMFIAGDQAFTDIVTENKNGKKLLVFKESYGNAFVPYMIDYYEEIIVLDIRKESQSVADIIRQYGITDALIINNVQGACSLQGYLSDKLAS